MRNFKFNTDGTIKEIANIIEQQLEIINKGSQFDVEKIEDTKDIDGEQMIRVTLSETELKDDGDSFTHEVNVHKIDVHEYEADLHLVY